ncbi:MAG: hypothetical protein CVU48_08885 [Candidatus Cloacimonetes bacterium HGW-Cloacimonetes-1]|jgi:PAS domain S-box-containing protein|nr:MAG: hypothetical protein CVU48_08885 [Candidatus Cloacimonetes bacterium HGW-Cloacimonetes-1]
MNQAPNRMILLVEPQPEVASIYSDILASLGFEIILAGDTHNACTIVDTHFDAILLSSASMEINKLPDSIKQLSTTLLAPVLVYCDDTVNPIPDLTALECNCFISLATSPSVLAIQIRNTINQYRKYAKAHKHLSFITGGEIVYQQLVEGMMEGMMVVDNDDVILYTNPKFNDLLGYSDRELIGKIGYEALVQSDDKQSIIQRNQQRQLGISEEYELYMLTKSGETVCFEMKAAPITDASGTVIGSMALCLNITEQKQAKQKIDSLLQEKEMLLREVHHRIKNNMSTISGLLSLQAMEIDNEDAVEALNDARGRVLSMMYIYDKLYRSSDFTHISTADYFRDLINSIKMTFQGICDAEIDTHFGSCSLVSDQLIPLGILLNELITNSFKYAFPDSHKGKITIRCSQDEQGVHILNYSDNGIGISEQYLLQHQESFGMSLVEMLVKQLRGTMDINTDHGTHYTIKY